MKEQFVPYETARMLKGLGFDKNTNAYYPIIEREKGRLVIHAQYFDYNDKTCFSRTYDHRCSAPLWQQVKQWLWEKEKIWVYRMRGDKKNEFTYRIIKDETVLFELNSGIYYSSPITAETEGIKKAIEYLHEKK